jgi:hypothetical protein
MRLVDALAIAVVALAAAWAQAAPAPAAKPARPAAVALEQAAADLAEGRLEAAQGGFEKAAKDAAAWPFERGLALLGQGEAAAARKDAAAATAAWQRLADDATLPLAHRDSARRRIAQAQRVQKGLPAYDPAEYREKLPALPEGAAMLHVAPAAGPAGDGDGSAARPLATPAKARDAIRAMKKAGGGKLPAGGVRVVIHGGVYPVAEALALTAEDSGTADCPIVYQAAAGETPILDGGIAIPAWRGVSDAKAREKLDPAVRDRVVEADLKALGVKDLGDATDLRKRPELYCGGVPQTLARWPNEGFVKTGEVPDKTGKKGVLHYTEDRPATWADEPDVRLYGYWYWDWHEQFQKVAAIDAAARTFTLAEPYASYGYRKGQRYCAVNVFRELDQPGEWYLDRRTGTIYWLPPAGVEPGKAGTVFSVLATPFVTLENVEHVVLLGLTFQHGRGDGIRVRGGADCLLAGCTLRRLGGDAIIVAGGKHHGIFGCTMHTLGCGGAKVAGGDLKTLTPGRHFVENCTVFDISRYQRTYTPAVLLERGGCGNRIAHCLFERMPSSAMRIEGSDQLIELNVVRRAVEESDDQGGVDMWGNPLYRGVVIRWNRWSDIRGGTICGAAGIRLDDMISGVSIHGNVFERCGAVLFGGVQIHGGKENLVDNNVFLDCPAAISFSRWGAKRWLELTQPFLAQAGEAAYLARWPELARLKEDVDVNFVSRNVFARCKDALIRDGGIEPAALNWTSDQALDVDAAVDAAAVQGNARLRQILFEPIPVSDIGPYPHAWRAAAEGGK